MRIGIGLGVTNKLTPIAVEGGGAIVLSFEPGGPTNTLNWTAWPGAIDYYYYKNGELAGNSNGELSAIVLAQSGSQWYVLAVGEAGPIPESTSNTVTF